MNKLKVDTLVSPICKIFFEIRKIKDRDAFLQQPILGDFRGSNFT